MDIMKLSTAISKILLAKRANGRAPRTIQDYERVLYRFLDWVTDNGLSLESLDRDNVRRYVAHLRGLDWAASTVGIHVRYLRAFLRFVCREGYLGEDLSLSLDAPKKHLKQDMPPTKRELRALLGACEGKWGIRDKAIILTMIDTGMRRGEVYRLTLSDIFKDEHGYYIRIDDTKTDHYRWGFLGERASEAMRDYLELREKREDSDLHALWISDRKGQRLGYDGIWQVVRRRAESAGLDTERIYPHAFRKYFATKWIEAGGDEQRLMRLGGWASSEMLEVYVRLGGKETLRQAHNEYAPGDLIGIRTS
jgi:site-specific recombinase XerD